MESISPEAAAGATCLGRFAPAGRTYRFVLLFFVSLLTFGSYFAYDSIGAPAPTLIQELHLDRETIGSLYSAYSLGGDLHRLLRRHADRPARAAAGEPASSRFLVTAGAVIVAVADSTWMLYLGRFVFGAGSESLVVAQSAIIARWFKGKELALAFGIALTLSRLGTLFSFNTEQMIASYFNDFHAALWAAALLCGLSLLCNLVYNVMDLQGERALDLPRAGGRQDRLRRHREVRLVVLVRGDALRDLLRRDLPVHRAVDRHVRHQVGVPVGAGDSGGFLWQIFASFFHMFSTAGGITSIIIFASMVCAPFAGSLLDRVGRRASMMVIGSLLLIPAHLVMGVTHWNPIPSMVVLGVAFVLVPAALWPSVPMVVEESRVGTAFGLLTAIQNVGLMVFPKASGWLIDRTGDYTATQVMFAGLGAAGLAFAFLLLRSDRRHGGVLEAGKTASGGA